MRNVVSAKSLTVVLIGLYFSCSSLFSQTHLPDISLKGIDGKEYTLSEFGKTKQPTVVVFWATWCKPCLDELDNIADCYIEWKDEEDFSIVAICIDDSRTSSSIRSFVTGRQWPFLILTDNNQELKRAMNVTDVPHYYLFNKNGNIAIRHTGYMPGDEDILFEEIKELNNEK